jgi:hypothetical protein
MVEAAQAESLTIHDLVTKDLQADFPNASEERLETAAEITTKSLMATVARSKPDLGAALRAGRETRSIMTAGALEDAPDLAPA